MMLNHKKELGAYTVRLLLVTGVLVGSYTGLGQFLSIWQGANKRLLLVGIAAFFLLYGWLGFVLFLRVVRNNPAALTTFYLAHKVVRLLICLSLVLVYGWLYGRDVVWFVVTFFLFFVVFLVVESYSFIRVESKIKQEQ